MRVKLTPAYVDNVTPPARDREFHWDTALPGFALMVTARGHKTYVIDYRADGHHRRLSLKPGLTLTQARREAKITMGAVAKGGDPLAERRKAARATSETLKAIIDEYIAKEGGRLRTIDERKRVLNRLVIPKLGNRAIENITRTDVVRLLDDIAESSGAPMADHVLAYLRRVMTWHASRSDTFRPPIVRGMARTSPTQRRRQRILTDAELRALWKTAEASRNVYSYLVQFLLLTATRRSEAAGMRNMEVSGEKWIIPEVRYKTGMSLLLPLSPLAQSVLAKLPKVGRVGFVFTTDGQHPISGFSKFKDAFEADMLADLRREDPDAVMPRWTLHDLRRTARSLMSRCGVPSDHAERCLGHVVGGVRGVYDVWEYFPEKKHAFASLAALVERIVRTADDTAPSPVTRAV